MESGGASDSIGMGDLMTTLTSQSIDFYAACLIWVLVASLVYNCTGSSFSTTTYFSHGNQGVTVIGNRVISNYTTVEAHKLKVVAFDAEDNVLESVMLPRGTAITLNITTQGNIDTVRASQAKIVVTSCGSITTLRNSQGNIHIGVAENVQTIRNSQGDIKIDSCNTVGATRTSQGDIKVRQRSPARPAPT